MRFCTIFVPCQGIRFPPRRQKWRHIKAASAKLLLDRPVISVPEAGQILGISRNGAYDAAKRGDFETLRIGKLVLVPVAPLKRRLGID
jgi:hypothetical protein